MQISKYLILILFFGPYAVPNAIAQFTYYEEGAGKKEVTTDVTVFYIDARIGAALPTGEPLNRTYDTGLNGALGIKINVLRNRLFFKPKFGFQYFKNEPQSDLVEKLVLYEMGAEIEYSFFYDDIEDFAISGFLDLSYNVMRDYYLFKGDKINVLDGEDLGLLVGMRFRYHIFYLDFGFKTLDLNANADPEEVAYWNSRGITILPVNVADLSSFNINAGVSVPLKLFKKKSS